MTCKKLYILFFLFAILVSCNEDVEQQAQLDMTLCLPANEVVHRAGGPRRVMGDPGTSEQFDLPKYVYIFVLKQEGDTWSIWRKEERTLADAEWKRTRYGGQNATRGDSIFKYNEKIRYFLVGEKVKGRIYAICSNKKLTFNPSFGSISNLDEVLGLKFSTADSIQENLQNIYSTPYDYERNGSYYCSYDCMAGNTYTIDMLLYHVAAKVDIKWNVAEEKRIDKVTPANGVRLTYMEARRLFNGDAYCFKPMRNELADPVGDEGYAIENIVTPTDEGLWWEGREYFYTIPYTVEGDEDYFPLQMKMGTNGTKGTAQYEPTLKLEIDTSSVFVPWLRANFNISAPLPIDSPTKTVNN